MALPEQLLLSDLLRRHVRCDRGLDHGAGQMAWMHPPVHRLLGWVSKPSALQQRRLVWRLDQLRGLSETEAFVKGEPAASDAVTVQRLPTLLQAQLLGAEGQLLGTVADAAVELRSGRIAHYLVARSDPRLPGTSRWRLSPERIVDQKPGRVFTALHNLDDLPLARASLRQDWLRRSRRWRDQVGRETSRLRERFQEAGGVLEDRLEGWLEEPPWDGSDRERPGASTARSAGAGDPLDDWPDDWPASPDAPPDGEDPPASRSSRPPRRPSSAPAVEDPWV
ncbi:MAG: RNA methyltransferase [Cyanobacteriota bacterium]|nr:RNA methyltransferase [Cyanobacteriota bacterium]